MMLLKIEVAGGQPQQYTSGACGIEWDYLDHFLIVLTADQEAKVAKAKACKFSSLDVSVVPTE